MMMTAVKKLRDAGVIGINERNEALVGRYNGRRAIRLVDDKTITKQLAQEAGIPTPALYGTVRKGSDCRSAARMIDCNRGAVIKPAHGSQGKGILILLEKARAAREAWRRTSGDEIAEDDLKFHLSNVMSGMYSLGGERDVAMIEERVQFDNAFDDISVGGVPDIRIVALKGVPIAAMLRLPTQQSDGKANLHQGGVGVGVNIPTGVTHNSMQHGKRISAHPDTGAPLNGRAIPEWHHMMMIAAKAYEMTGLGYLGVDIVMDKAKGPLLLELNARPGLAIQIANGEGLRHRGEAIAGIDTVALDAEARVKLASEVCA